MHSRFFSLFIVVASLLGFISGSAAQSGEYQFARYSTEKGLSHNQVNCFLKDRQGFVWVGTADGLNRFDGYSFKIFKHTPNDSSAIADHHINDLFEDPEGFIWIRTPKGFNIYDPTTESIDQNADRAARRLGIPDANLTRIVKAKNGDYWISHNQLGLLKYLPGPKKLLRIRLAPNDQLGKPLVISDFNEDSKGDIWAVYTNGLLIKVDGKKYKQLYRSDLFSVRIKGNSITHRVFVDNDGDPWIYTIKAVRGIFHFDISNNSMVEGNTSSSTLKLSNNIVSAMIIGPDGRPWIGTDHGGINIIDKQAGTVTVLSYNPNDPKTISQNSVMALYKDDTGMIWAGTFKKGFCNYHKNIFKFSFMRHLPMVGSSLPFDDVSVFAEDKKGNVWVGSNGGGLIYYDRSRNSFKQYQNIPGDATSLSNNVIVSLFLDSKDVLWIGTYFGGLNSFDGKNFKRYLHNPADSTSLIDDRVWEIFEDSQKRLWVGTLGDGLDLFDRDSKVFKHFRPNMPNSISSDYISAIMEDREGNIWIGTAFGIDVLMKETNRFVHYKYDAGKKGSLSSDAITAITQDALGNIWVGTLEGLNLFDAKTKQFKVFGLRDGLPDNSVLSLVTDSRQNLWIGTPKGLVFFEIAKRHGIIPESVNVRTYNEVDGLQGRSFNENAALRLRSGELIFGGASGFTIFSPEKIEEETRSAHVELTDFQVFNKSVKPGEQLDGKIVLENSISQTNKITLKHSQNVFTIEFAALNFLHADKNHYLYTLEGFNDQWFEADNNTRKVTYTNLDPGKYTFKVKTQNGSLTSSERILNIEILPPFWKTPLAYLLYFISIIGALAMARWILLERERMNFRLEQERREAQQLHELDLMKIKFFTNVSHEFRTPLTLMLTPLEGLLNSIQADSGIRNQLSLIHRNAKRLLNLVTQLLDFKKMEVEETEYTPERGDIVQFIREIAHTFSDLSERKKIAFSFQSDAETRYTLFDQEKLSRIMYNLLSNAFKFTPEAGQIGVRLNVVEQEETHYLQISVSDSGIGIPTEDQPKVFDRFFQHNLPSHIVNGGSGIGLSITREFVKLHNGTIEVKSEVGAGSTFTILMPLVDAPGTAGAVEVAAVNYDSQEDAGEWNSVNKDRKRPILLLVEDNDEFREYMRETLQKEYQIHEAPNGKLGLEMTMELIPDLIVSDVMMPEMDGMELCRNVKTDTRVSHIPVILLTARAEDEQQLQGYETGADAYITKPFRLDILLVRIRNLIKRRELVQKQFQQHIKVQPSEIAIRSVDEAFISKAVKVVEDNISNAEFTVEELSSEMAMSRMYLYKKLLSLTGKTPVEFIRIIRMRRAASLLEKSQLTISEIAYQVGFNNPKYFARLFKDEFKVLPTEYRKKEIMNE
jgi:signal transduction histidine kinase/ligand-binding sensor domain-containing protein/DNA-binding response OmpR family regulator